jgi:hypothetical protein
MGSNPRSPRIDGVRLQVVSRRVRPLPRHSEAVRRLGSGITRVDADFASPAHGIDPQKSPNAEVKTAQGCKTPFPRI